MPLRGGVVCVALPGSRRRLLLVGDSHVVDLAPFLKPLVETAGWDFTSHGDVGKSTAWYGRQDILDELVQQYRPHLVVVVLGTNDEGAEGSPNRYRQQIDTVLRKLGGAKVVWVGTPTIPRSVEEDTGAAARNRILVQHPGLVAIDSRKLTGNLGALRTPDGVHFTRKGYEEWAKRIFTQTENLLRAKSSHWRRWVAALSLVGIVVTVWYAHRKKVAWVS